MPRARPDAARAPSAAVARLGAHPGGAAEGGARSTAWLVGLSSWGAALDTP
jgi:hypothetical protein